MTDTPPLPSNLPAPIPTKAHKDRKSLAGSIAFTVVLLGAIALALHGSSPVTAFSTVIAVIFLVSVFHIVFSDSDFFSIIFANSVGVYASIYVMFVEANFPQAHAITVQVAFLLPLAAFAAGVFGHRRQIQHLIDRTRRHVTVPLREAVRWVGPLLIVAVVTTYLQIRQWTTDTQDVALIISMSVIGLVAWFTSKHIALFLMECGLIFRSFLHNAARLARPAFALLTCYFLITIIFGCIYTIYDQLSASSHFLTNGAEKTLTFLMASTCPSRHSRQWGSGTL